MSGRRAARGLCGARRLRPRALPSELSRRGVRAPSQGAGRRSISVKDERSAALLRSSTALLVGSCEAGSPPVCGWCRLRGYETTGRRNPLTQWHHIYSCSESFRPAGLFADSAWSDPLWPTRICPGIDPIRSRSIGRLDLPPSQVLPRQERRARDHPKKKRSYGPPTGGLTLVTSRGVTVTANELASLPICEPQPPHATHRRS